MPLAPSLVCVCILRVYFNVYVGVWNVWSGSVLQCMMSVLCLYIYIYIYIYISISIYVCICNIIYRALYIYIYMLFNFFSYLPFLSFSFFSSSIFFLCEYYNFCVLVNVLVFFPFYFSDVINSLYFYITFWFCVEMF